MTRFAAAGLGLNVARRNGDACNCRREGEREGRERHRRGDRRRSASTANGVPRAKATRNVASTAPGKGIPVGLLEQGIGEGPTSCSPRRTRPLSRMR